MRERLHAWLAEQEVWQQDLARRLLGSSELEGAAYEAALAMVTAAFGVAPDGAAVHEAQPISLEEFPERQVTGSPRLVHFGSLRGVGAVSDEHTLRFAADGLTIVYGDNAAGKTTYVRALKCVCRAVDRDAQVRGNVFAPADAETPLPRAQVGLQGSGLPDAQQVDLSDPQVPGLQAISVFDSDCAELYLDQQNAVAFVPTELRVLARLAATQDRMRADLRAQIETLRAAAPRFPELAEGTSAARLVAGLSATTDAADVDALATIEGADATRLVELRAIVASAEAQRSEADARAAGHDEAQAQALLTQLRALGGDLRHEQTSRVRNLATEARAKKAAATAATSELAALPFEGLGSAEWRVLWDAARSFAEAADETFPPGAGQRCPLCLQEIPAPASTHLEHFEEHVRSTVQAESAQAEALLAEALAPFRENRLQEVRAGWLAGLDQREPELHTAITKLIDGVGERFTALRSEAVAYDLSPPEAGPIDQLERWRVARQRRAEGLLAAAQPERQAELRRELNELEAREKLGQRKQQIEAWLGQLQLIGALEQARSALATNRITTKQRELSEEEVTGGLNSRLQRELDNLGCQISVQLHPHTRVGEPEVALRLAGARGTPRVSDIASEGEQRALSLAFFFAEVATSDSDGGIIVDDPVSSLDDTRREYIAARLVEEAAHRQVIVFTHDLPFLFDLSEQARQAGLEPLIQGIWRLGGDVGRVDDHPPFKAMRFRERVGALTQEVQEWKSQPQPRDFDEAWRRVADFYARLRTTWERGVEERLFNGVVQRFQRAVETQRLDGVDVTENLKEAVKEGMTRCSMFVHDEPPASTTPLPDRTALSADLEKLRAFENATRR